MIPPTILSNLSGGVDSTYATWRHLADKPHTRLLIHHIHQRGHRRHEHEYKAVQAILAWFKSKDLTNFEYIETQGPLLPSGVRKYQDIEFVGFSNGLILKSRPEITQVMIHANAQDLRQGSGYRRRAQNRFLFLETLARRKPEYLYPLRLYSKPELIRKMDPELYALCWWCRTPTPQGEMCGACDPCRKIT